MRQPPRRLLVSLFHDVRWGRDFVRGMAEEARQGEAGWQLQLRSPAEPLEGVWAEGKWDGAVIQVIDEAGDKAAKTAPCPVLLVDPRAERLPHLSRVLFDHTLCGELAAEHLLETGRRHHAFVGFSGAKISERREASYLRRMGRAGHEPDVLRVPVSLLRPRSRLAPERLPEIGRFLLRQPLPLAVFAGNDELARGVLEACLARGLKVPEQVAVLGADDDDLLCLTCSPTLSSVRFPYERAGREAARLLIKLISGASKPPFQAMVAPTTVETRESTRVVPGEDPLVETVMRQLNQAFAEDVRMDQVAALAGVSLSTLERRFKASLGRTPLEELRRLRVFRAKALLTQTDMTAAQVARACGFNSAIRFSIVFRELTGVTPMAHRRAEREKGG